MVAEEAVLSISLLRADITAFYTRDQRPKGNQESVDTISNRSQKLVATSKLSGKYQPSKIPAAEMVGRTGHLTLKHSVAKYISDRLKEIKIEDLSSEFKLPPSTYGSAAEVMWLQSKHKEFDVISGWNGFTEKATENLTFEKTYTVCIRFIKCHNLHRHPESV